ncbi:uncharacterized protein LOC62_03G004178 [Vanrija pseudolonga]|uniref:F-box domain-containing protein n=1 Tax=Vanrija pseudolonga TaxID=143232 RepID=A0AAF1BQ99_9TREE|nr:hypothetical protein LOC62_03G004178 [Vanrija pseudolonga]
MEPPNTNNLGAGTVSRAPVTAPNDVIRPPSADSLLSEVEASFGDIILGSTSSAAEEVDEHRAGNIDVTSFSSSSSPNTEVAPARPAGTTTPSASSPSFGLVDALGTEPARVVLSHLTAHDIASLLQVCKEDNRHINTFIRETALSLKMHKAYCNVSPPDLTTFSSEVRSAITPARKMTPKEEMDDLLATQDGLMLARSPEINIYPAPRSKLLGVAHGFAVIAHNLTESPVGNAFPEEWPYEVGAISVIQLPGAGCSDKSPFGPNAKVVNGMWTWRWKLQGQGAMRILKSESSASISIEDNLLVIACRRDSDIVMASFSILPVEENGPGGQWPEYDSGPVLHPSAWDPLRSLFSYDLGWSNLPTFTIKLTQDSTIGVLVNIRMGHMADQTLPPGATVYFEVFDWKTGLLKGGLAPGRGLRVLDFDFLEHDNIMTVTHSYLAGENESPLRLEVWSPPAPNFQAYRQPTGDQVFSLVNGAVNHTICLVPIVAFDLEASSNTCIGREGLHQVEIESASLETQGGHRGEAVGVINVRVIIEDRAEYYDRAFFKMSVVNKVVRDVRQARDSALGPHLKFGAPNPYFRPGDPADPTWLSSVYDMMAKVWDTRTVPWSAFQPFVLFYQGGYGTSAAVSGAWSVHLQQAFGGSAPLLQVFTYNEPLNSFQRVDEPTNAKYATGDVMYGQARFPEWLRISLPSPTFFEVREKAPKTPLSGNDDWHAFLSSQFSPLSYLAFEMMLPPDPVDIESTTVKFDGKHAVIVREEAWHFLNAWAMGFAPPPQDPADGSLLIITFGDSALVYKGKGKGKADG